VNEVIKLMWHNMIGQCWKIFLESKLKIQNHKNNDFNSYNPKKSALYYYLKVVIKHISTNISQIRISRPFKSLLNNKNTSYKHIVVFLKMDIVFLGSKYW
jgi:hypothetical protein